MKRSHSYTSHFTMSQFEFNPFETDNYLSEGEIELPDGAQPLPPGSHGLPISSPEIVEEETESEEPSPEVHSDVTFPTDITFTNTNELRTILATLSGFSSGRLGCHLIHKKGLILLPLHAVTSIRTIAGHHVMQYPCIVFYPRSYPEDIYRQTFPNLMDAIDNFYSKH